MPEETKLPTHLYKYRSWSNPLHKRIITEREIWFASPRSFNDPFDCQLYSVFTESDRDQIITHLVRHFSAIGTDEEKANPAQFAEIVTNRLISRTESENEEFVSMMISRCLAYTGVFTTSSNYNDILMWSHYSDSHRGFCVEINTMLLMQFIESQLATTGLPILPYSVTYGNKYPALVRLPGMSSEDWMKQYLIKSIKWKHEGEYRLISMRKTDFPYPLGQGVITKVILGCEMPDSDQEAVIHELLRLGGDIALEKAVKLKDEFALDFVPVNY